MFGREPQRYDLLRFFKLLGEEVSSTAEGSKLKI
jgi:hypothetical protein